MILTKFDDESCRLFIFQVEVEFVLSHFFSKEPEQESEIKEENFNQSKLFHDMTIAFLQWITSVNVHNKEKICIAKYSANKTQKREILFVVPKVAIKSRDESEIFESISFLAASATKRLHENSICFTFHADKSHRKLKMILTFRFFLAAIFSLLFLRFLLCVFVSKLH